MENKKNKKIKFSKKGWGIIIYSILLLYFMTGMTVDGLNVIVPGMASLRGWEANTVLSISTPASIIALILVMPYGYFISKFELKRVTVASLILGGLTMIWYAHATSLISYAIALTLMITFVNGFAVICGFSIVANWFPRNKGFVLGITTMGMNLASATIVIVLTFFSNIFNDMPEGNISQGITIMGAIILIVAAFTYFKIKVTPEDAGELPDNEPIDQSNKLDEALIELDNSPPLRYIDIIKMPQTWIMGIAYGFIGMATVGIMSQLVPFLTTRGYEFSQAVAMLSIAAIIGLFGSYMWGVIDQKKGTKRASVLFGIWYGVGIFLLTIPTKPTLYIGLFLLGLGIGGNGNFPPSMVTSVFGRKDFSNAYSIVNTIVGVVRSAAFIILAIILSKTGGKFEIAYRFFGIVAILESILISTLKTKGTTLDVGDY